MGYLKVIESSYTWVCPKTATYKIICVSGGGNNSAAEATTANHGGYTSFGTYCTVSGCWGDGVTNGSGYNGNTQGYTLMDYAKIFTATSSVKMNIGYGAGIGGTKDGIGTLGKLKVAICDIKKDEEVVCTVGAGKTCSSDNSKANDGVIVVQEISEILEDNITPQSPAMEYKINIYRYNELYQTITVKENEILTFPTVPLYNTDKYEGDVEHIGWSTAHDGKVIYKPGQSIYLSKSLDYYAVYKTNYKITGSIYGGGPNDNDDYKVTVSAKYNGSISSSCSKISYTTTSGGQMTGTTSESVSNCVSGVADILINGISIGTFGSKSVNEGDTITLIAYGNYVVSCTYPEFGYTNKS